jgi:hypothetical protein
MKTARVPGTMRSRRFFIAIVGVGVIGILAGALWPEKAEPAYKGRKLSYWTIHSVIAPDTACHEAFEHIGTNGIPCYMEWLKYSPGWVKRAEVKFAEQGNSWLHLNWYPNDANYLRAYGAYMGLIQLGERAEPIIPQLLACSTNVVKRGSRTFLQPALATDILAHLGRPAVTPLLSLMTNENPRVRVTAVIAARDCGDPLIGAQLRSSLQDRDRSVRTMATNSLKEYENFGGASRKP